MKKPPKWRLFYSNQNHMEDNKDNKDGNQLNIELTEEMAEGVYSNLAIMTHSHAEFIVDFIQVLPGTPKAKVKSRVIMTPHHAKRLLEALNDNIRKYESLHGEIKTIDNTPSGSIPMNFGGPTTKA